MENDLVESADAVDISARACEIAHENIVLNNAKGISVINADIRHVLLDRNYDLVEIDPFGTPAPYIWALSESCMRRRTGHFSITATDTAVLCGAEQKACRRGYGSAPLHDEIVHEGALRILAAHVQRVLAQNNIAVFPVLSLSHRHYLKMFFRFERSASKADRNLNGIMHMGYCRKCRHRIYMRTGDSGVCEVCGSEFTMAGPFWSGLLDDAGIIGKVSEEIAGRGYKNSDEEMKILAQLEKQNFEGMCYDLHKVFAGMPIPKTCHAIGALSESGFSASETIYKKWIIRTDAAVQEIRDAVKK